MNYALGHAFSLSDLFEDFNPSSISVKGSTCEELIGYKNKRDLAKSIFSYSVKLILDDLIKEDINFKLPTGSKYATLGMQVIEGDQFAESRRNGKFLDIDFLSSDFTGYQPVFRYQFKKAMHKKPFYLNKEYKQLIAKRTNEGKAYT